MCCCTQNRFELFISIVWSNNRRKKLLIGFCMCNVGCAMCFSQNVYNIWLFLKRRRNTLHTICVRNVKNSFFGVLVVALLKCLTCNQMRFFSNATTTKVRKNGVSTFGTQFFRLLYLIAYEQFVICRVWIFAILQCQFQFTLCTRIFPWWRWWWKKINHKKHMFKSVTVTVIAHDILSQ